MTSDQHLIVIRDPILGCIPEDVTQLLMLRGYAPLMITPEEFTCAPAELLETAEVVVCGVSVRFDSHLMDRMPRLKTIVSAVIGTDAIAIEQAKERGIEVAHSPAMETSESMAEATVLLILACSFDLRARMREFEKGWSRPPRPTGRTLMGKTVGLIGFGRTARGVARRLTAWGVEILAFDRGKQYDEGKVKCVSLETLLCNSNIVSLHLPLTPETEMFLDKEHLSMLPDGAIVVNTARGRLIDEQALAQQVQAGRIRAVGLDVFASEPPTESVVLELGKTSIFTPHALGHTQESFNALSRMAAENADCACRGLRIPYLAN